ALDQRAEQIGEAADRDAQCGGDFRRADRAAMAHDELQYVQRARRRLDRGRAVDALRRRGALPERRRLDQLARPSIWRASPQVATSPPSRSMMSTPHWTNSALFCASLPLRR